MTKFLAIVKREYVQRVRTKFFIIATIMAPLVMTMFAVVPMVVLNFRTGGPMRVAVVDQTGQLYGLLAKAVTDIRSEEAEAPAVNPEALNANSTERVKATGRQQTTDFQLEEIKLDGRSLDDVKRALNERIRDRDLDIYLVLPPDLLTSGAADFFGGNTGDVFSREHLEDALSDAVRERRLIDANIDSRTVRALSEPVNLHATKVGTSGEEKETGMGAFILVFAAGFVIYLTILMYGQIVLGAVIEEKETRIAEILFSSAKPFTLMVGKIVGVSLVALTQLAVWGTAFLAFTMIAARGLPFTIPDVPAIVFVYFVLFFLLGYFIYATIYALVGSMVTTAQEGGQLAMPIILFLVIGFYLAFPVIQRPDSWFAFWVSMFPLFSPITMLVRIVTQTPPFWQILLSLTIGFGTALLLAWLAGRIYRVGMLMYGKKASLPEVWRWVRQP